MGVVGLVDLHDVLPKRVDDGLFAETHRWKLAEPIIAISYWK